MTTSVLFRSAPALLLACWVAACSIGDNPRAKCENDGDCKEGVEICYQRFCIPKEDGGSSGTGGSGGKDDGGGSKTDGGPDGGDAAMTDGGDAGTVDGGDGGGALGVDTDVGKPCDPATTQYLCFYAPPALLTGECRAGSHACECEASEGKECKQGTWGECEGDQYPGMESCNRRDDDCDREIDEDLNTASCMVPEQKGECAKGQSACESGFEICNQVNEAKTEECNGRDDDCDGSTDEHTDKACYDGTSGCMWSDVEGRYICQGLCAAGMQRCDKGVPGICDNQVTPATAESCAMLDNRRVDENCNGETDENCACDDVGMTYACYGGTGMPKGICRAGTQTCMPNNQLGECTGQVLPGVETCANEGTDDDCDDQIDDIDGRDDPCSIPSKRGRCRNGTRQCMGGEQLTCVTLEPITELCNMIDDDCDGMVDDGFEFETDRDNCGACGVQCAADEICCDGGCVKPQEDGNYCGNCTTRCSPAQKCCFGTCEDVLSDVNNCRTCGNRCPGVLGLLPACCAGTCGSIGCGG